MVMLIVVAKDTHRRGSREAVWRFGVRAANLFVHSRQVPAAMNRRLALFSVAALTLLAIGSRTAAAQTGGTPPPADTAAAVDPVGTYVIYLTAQGNAMTLIHKIEKKADGTFGGSVTGEGIPALPINSVKVTGKTMRVSVTAPDGTEAIMTMVLDGDQVTGEWSMNGDGSKLTGKKQP
jgi:hypothetical protein